MTIITIKNKYQIVIPAKVRKEAGLHVGDFLEAGFEKGKITLTPKLLIDRAIVRGLEDVKTGKIYGPFDTASGMVASLKVGIQRIHKSKAQSKLR